MKASRLWHPDNNRWFAWTRWMTSGLSGEDFNLLSRHSVEVCEAALKKYSDPNISTTRDSSSMNNAI